MSQEQSIKALIAKYAQTLHEQLGAVIDSFMVSNHLPEDAVTLNIVFNALSNNLQAIVQNNHDIPEDSVELMISVLSTRLRNAYRSRSNNQQK